MLIGAPERIRTSDLCLRRAALYPAELRAPAPDLTDGAREFNEPFRHRASRIGERIDDGEMIGAGDLDIARGHALLSPGVGDGAALAQELIALLAARPGVERAGVHRDFPEQG